MQVQSIYTKQTDFSKAQSFSGTRIKGARAVRRFNKYKEEGELQLYIPSLRALVEGALDYGYFKGGNKREVKQALKGLPIGLDIIPTAEETVELGELIEAADSKGLIEKSRRLVLDTKGQKPTYPEALFVSINREVAAANARIEEQAKVLVKQAQRNIGSVLNIFATE